MKQANKLGVRNKVGAYGEQIAANYLQKKNFTILDTNYLKKWGEIDIVARETVKGKHTLHFVEVKAVSYETRHDLEQAVTRRTWRPEENVHFEKIQRLNRTIESWITEHCVDSDWQIDVITVRVVLREKYASINYLPNIVFD